MAIKKNQDAITAAINAAASSTTSKAPSNTRAQRSLPKGTIGSVRAGLGGIQEIDTKYILSWGPADRLDVELTSVNNEDMPETIEGLANSLLEAGQQVPVLLRPAKDRDGYFEVIYGRRRILACRYLGIKVKALIRTLDDTEALMAKGLENANRTDLSFYERARFATAIIAQGYDRATACQALTVSKNTLSQLERVTRLIPDTVGDAIGAAPETGRPKWMALAAMFESGEIEEQQCLVTLRDCTAEMSSDDRFALLTKAKPSPSYAKRKVHSRAPIDGVEITSGKSTISLSIKRNGKYAAFADWLDLNFDTILKDSFQQFQAQKKKR